MILTALVCDLPMRTLDPEPGGAKLLHLLQNAIRRPYGMRTRFLVPMALAAAACAAASGGSPPAVRAAIETSAPILSSAIPLFRSDLPTPAPPRRAP